MGFGLNSFKIKEQLGLNPINTGIDASIGAKYMLENTLNYVQKGDVVVLGLEYLHFVRPYDYTSGVLLRIVTDILPEKLDLLSFSQKVSLLQYVPKFSLSKLKPSEYRNIKKSKFYSAKTFNQFGDINAHWDVRESSYSPTTIRGNIHMEVIEKLQEFEVAASQKGARVLLTFPVLDEVSFANSKQKVLEIERLLKQHDFEILGSAERYIMPKNMIFDSPYHLNKTGLEHRTQLFIEDYLNYSKHAFPKE